MDLIRLCLISSILAYSIPAFSANLEEFTVKSALTFNLAVFTEWPEGVFKKQNDTLNICVIGNNIVQEAFIQLTDKKVTEHAVNVLDITRSRNIERCHIIFIGNQDRVLLSQIQAISARKPILTIDDIDDNPSFKSIVNLQNTNDKIQLNINLNAAQQAGLKISARLLKLANIVSTNP